MINFNTIMGWIGGMMRAMWRNLWAEAEAPPPAAAPPPTAAPPPNQAVGAQVLASSVRRMRRALLAHAPAPRPPLWPAPGPIWYNASSQALLPGYWEREE